MDTLIAILSLIGAVALLSAGALDSRPVVIKFKPQLICWQVALICTVAVATLTILWKFFE